MYFWNQSSASLRHLANLRGTYCRTGKNSTRWAPGYAERVILSLRSLIIEIDGSVADCNGGELYTIEVIVEAAVLSRVHQWCPVSSKITLDLPQQMFIPVIAIGKKSMREQYRFGLLDWVVLRGDTRVQSFMRSTAQSPPSG